MTTHVIKSQPNNTKPVAGELWKRNGREEYYFINSITRDSRKFDIVNFIVIRDGEKSFEADTDMDNFIKCTIRIKQ